MSIIDTAKEWLFGIAIKKGVKRAIQALISIAVAKGVPLILSNFGVQVDPAKFEIELTTATFAGLEVLRNWLKVKLKISWI